MQKLMGRIRAALERYDMIEDGDRVAVGVSGGKDSVALLAALAEMRRYYPKKYEVTGLSLDMGFEGGSDFTPIADLCAGLGVEYLVKKTEIASIVFDYREEKNPCSLCAKMRRGALHDFTLESGCNKLALGHHMDDAAETFMMNLLRGGHIGCFCPVTYMSRKELYVIRPMILAKESMVASEVKRRGLPVVKSKCPMDGVSERQNMKNLIRELEREYPVLREKITGAMQRRDIDGW